MRHRSEAGSSKSVVNGVTGTLSKLTDLLAEQESVPGKHKQPTTEPLIPAQKVPTHETIEAPLAPEVDLSAQIPEQQTVARRMPVPEVSAPVIPLSSSIPATASWRAGHGYRMFSASLLVLAVAGTSALGLRYASHHTPSEFLALVVGIAIVVALWALLIASTPQVVSLRGSVLTVRNSSGSERFDLADGLQPVDVVGQPRSSGWALLLHRSNNTSVVLRRRDVDAVALDPIVRHYRVIAEQRYAERQVRFNS
jgi:hypothetical protein